MNETETRKRNRNRTALVLIAVMFFGSMAVAGLLRFSGWQPQGMKNHGELLQPAVDARTVVPRGLDGSEYRWMPEARTWRIVVAAPADCGADCIEAARQVELVWELFSKDADRVHVLWLGRWPEAAKRPATLFEIGDDDGLRGRLPQADAGGVPVYVLDPNGFVVLRYAPGFDPGGLRKDMIKLLKLR
ncbi:hypothetical protein [Marilutibacter chinensis]|uniref:Cytochrome oxidase Cu insertion factor (SCO1/SenC/PrrC family) n=1 Tax=Marilutibacter chinensis TaxID=2912247 RepID=A0ABS9HTW9_9GAMM|nr:hypothetical protein [Lysobacter chinensis]MCF7222128.1 hypothetical protein [Lysobacter chinensis]